MSFKIPLLKSAFEGALAAVAIWGISSLNDDADIQQRRYGVTSAQAAKIKKDSDIDVAVVSGVAVMLYAAKVRSSGATPS